MTHLLLHHLLLHFSLPVMTHLLLHLSRPVVNLHLLLHHLHPPNLPPDPLSGLLCYLSLFIPSLCDVLFSLVQTDVTGCHDDDEGQTSVRVGSGLGEYFHNYFVLFVFIVLLPVVEN
jgi:hypothetical protein